MPETDSSSTKKKKKKKKKRITLDTDIWYLVLEEVYSSHLSFIEQYLLLMFHFIQPLAHLLMIVNLLRHRNACSFTIPPRFP